MTNKDSNTLPIKLIEEKEQQTGNGIHQRLQTNLTYFSNHMEHRLYYHRGLSHWSSQRGYPLETCLPAQTSSNGRWTNSA